MQARKWQHCSWHVFACHALMEWAHRSQVQAEQSKCVHIVKGIFELGLKSPHVQCVPEYVKEYANWLVCAFPRAEYCAGGSGVEARHADLQLEDAVLPATPLIGAQKIDLNIWNFSICTGTTGRMPGTCFVRL